MQPVGMGVLAAIFYAKRLAVGLVLVFCLALSGLLRAEGGLLHTLSEDVPAAIIESAPSAMSLGATANGQTRSRSAEVTDWFTEFFSAGDFNLEYKTLTLQPAANPNGYVATLDSAFEYPVPISGDAVELALGDDEAVAIPLAPNAFPLHGVSYNTIYVSSNGIITMTGPNVGSNPLLALHFNTPRISGFHADLQPASGGGQGTIYRTSLADRVVITYDGVQRYLSTERNSFQVEMFYSGVIRITWLKMETNRGLVGVSKGGGLPSLLFQSNLRLYPSSGPFAVLPIEPVSFLQDVNDVSHPSAIPVALFRKSDAMTTWTSVSSANWLGVSPASGLFSGASRADALLSILPSASALEPGVHLAHVSFGTSGTGLTTRLAVRLEVTESDVEFTVTDNIGSSDDQYLPFGDVGVGVSVPAQVSLSNASLSESVQVKGVIIDGSYDQDFGSDTAPGWQPAVRTGGQNDWRVEDGRYLAGPSPITTGFMESTYSLQTFRDLVFEATIEHTGWDGSFAYLAIRGTPSGSGSLVAGSAYLFGISGNNGFSVFRVRDGVVTNILATSISPSVFTPPFSNRVRVEAVGPVLQFFVNGFYMGGVVDSSLTGAGRIGFVASSVASLDGLLVPAFAFDDIVVRRIPDRTDAFRLGGISSFPFGIAAEDDFSFDIIASPSSIGWYSSVARIVTNDALRPSIPVFLSTNGIPPPIGTVSIQDSIPAADDMLLDFDDLIVGTSDFESVTVSNSDPTHAVEVESIYLMNQREDDFVDPALPGWEPGNAAQWSQEDSFYVANAAGTPGIWMSSFWTDAPFGDGTLSVVASPEPNGPNSIYLFLRATPDFVLLPDGTGGGSAIMLASNSVGLYNISAFVDGNFRYLQSWLFTEAINTDGSDNEITFEYIDGRIRAAFNGVDVFEGELPPFIPGGNRVGIFAASGEIGQQHRFARAFAQSSELSGPFSMSGAPFNPVELNAGSTLPLSVEFAPTEPGFFGGAIQVRSNDFHAPLQQLNLTGSAVITPFDFNNDGILNVADVTFLANHLKGLIPVLPSDGDVNGDGVVDQADVEALAAMIVE